MTSNLPIYHDNGYKVMAGWRVGHAPEESTTRSGLLVPIGTKDGNDALTLVDVRTGQRFWAVPTGAWRFTPSGDGTTIDYRAALDVKGTLTGFILRRVTDGLVAASLPNMFASIEREVRKRQTPQTGA